MTENKLIYESTFIEACSVGRKAARFSRKDITVFLTKYRLFNLGEPMQVKLVDISSGGVQISSPKELKSNRPNNKLCVNLEFTDGNKFSIDSTIVRQEKTVSNYYQLAFECNALADKRKEASLNRVSLFEGSKQIHVKFRGLTYDKVGVLTRVAFDAYSPLYLIFTFSNGEKLKAFTKIVRQGLVVNHRYGIKFDKRNDLLGEHLVATQTDLFFC